MRPLALVLAVAACTPAALPEPTWRAGHAAAVAAVCTVTEHRPPERSGGQRWRDFVSEYDAARRLVRKVDQPELGATATTRYRYDAAGRLAGTTAFVVREAYDGDCDVEGGCAAPARRQIVETVYVRDGAGRVVEERRDERTFEERDGRWIEIDHDERSISSTYDRRGRLVEVRGERGTARYEYDGDRPRRRTWRERGYPPRSTVFSYDAAGRLARAQWGYDDRMVYDARGRLVAIRTTDTDSQREAYWEYDALGRVTRQGRRARYHRSGAAEDAYAEYRYDAGGRLVAIAHQGLPPSVEIGYQGRCEGVSIAPEPPVPMPGALDLCAAVKCPVD